MSANVLSVAQDWDKKAFHCDYQPSQPSSVYCKAKSFYVEQLQHFSWKSVDMHRFIFRLFIPLSWVTHLLLFPHNSGNQILRASVVLLYCKMVYSSVCATFLNCSITFWVLTTTKKSLRILMGIALELQNHFKRIDILIILTPFIHYTEHCSTS